MLSVERLEWDSEFFGFGVGRLSGSFESDSALTDVLRNAVGRGLRLIYGVCGHSDSHSHRIALGVGGRFVDIKRTYALGLRGVETKLSAIEEADNGARNLRQLRVLGWQAAEFSRFRIDSALPVGSWRRMYSSWVANSLNGQLADAVLVERGDGRIIGMISVSKFEKRGQIGLFAVDRRWRGRGIGPRLLEAAKQRCSVLGCDDLFVVTQGANVAACRSYERAGYRIVEEQDVFHFWTEKYDSV